MNVPPIVSLALQYSTIIAGTSDIGTGTSSISGDGVEISYCSGSPCISSSVQVASSPTPAMANFDTLAAGVYQVQACDTTYLPTVCSANVILTVEPVSAPPPPTVTLTLQYSTITVGTSDIGTGATSNTFDGTEITYCPSTAGVCTGAGVQAATSATNVVTYNFDTLAAGTYSVQACDTTYMPVTCSSNSILVVQAPSPPTVLLSLQFTTATVGTSDIGTGTTSNTFDGSNIIYCPASSSGTCAGAFVQAASSATNMVTYNFDTLGAGTYQVYACDTTYSPTACSQNSLLIEQVASPPSPPTVLLTIQSLTSTVGASDIGTGTTSNTFDGVEITYCPSTALGVCTGAGVHAASSATNIVTYNFDTLAAGTYSVQACDTTYMPVTCSANSILVEQAPSGATYSYLGSACGGTPSGGGCPGYDQGPAGYTTYFCAVGAAYPTQESPPAGYTAIKPTFAADIAMPSTTTTYAAITRSTSAFCFANGDPTQTAYAVLGLSASPNLPINVMTVSSTIVPVTSSSVGTTEPVISYTPTPGNFLVIAVACGVTPCQTISGLPAGCTVQYQYNANGVPGALNPAYGSAYIAVCPSAPAGTFTLSITNPAATLTWYYPIQATEVTAAVYDYGGAVHSGHYPATANTVFQPVYDGAFNTGLPAGCTFSVTWDSQTLTSTINAGTGDSGAVAFQSPTSGGPFSCTNT